MEAFCQLFRTLDETPGTGAKVCALVAFLERCSPGDAAWALQVLLGRQKRRLITGRRLREICLEGTEWPAWLFDDCHRQVGDSAETISLLWGSPRAREATPQNSPAAGEGHGSLAHWMEQRLPALAALEGEAQAQAVRACWSGLSQEQILVVNKLLTGGAAGGGERRAW